MKSCVPPVSPDELLTVREIAAHLKVSTATVYKIVEAGQLRTIRVGESIRCTREDLSQYLTRSTNQEKS